MTVARRIFTIQVEVQAPITIGSRDILDGIEEGLETGLSENAEHPAWKQRRVKDWDVGGYKVVNIRMAEEDEITQEQVIQTNLGPVTIRTKGGGNG